MDRDKKILDDMLKERKSSLVSGRTRSSLEGEIDRTMCILDFIDSYQGVHPLLVELRTKREQNPSFLPSGRDLKIAGRLEEVFTLGQPTRRQRATTLDDPYKLGLVDKHGRQRRKR